MNLDARTVATALGGDIVGRDSVLAPGPGHSRSDRSMSVKLDPAAPDGFLTYSHAGDDFTVCRDFVRERLGLERESPRQRAEWVFQRKLPTDDNHSAAMRLWRESVDPRGSLAERYLIGRRLELSDDLAGDVVRFHPRLAFRGEFSPAMVTLYRDIVTNEPRAVQRTFLDPEGNKLDRWMLGPVKNAAIKIDADENVEYGLHIGEGFESCLAAKTMGFTPVWSLGSSGAIRAFPVLPGIECLTIIVDNDPGGTGQAAALECSQRWTGAGREVFRVLPNEVGADLADIAKKRAA